MQCGSAGNGSTPVEAVMMACSSRAGGDVMMVMVIGQLKGK